MIADHFRGARTAALLVLATFAATGCAKRTTSSAAAPLETVDVTAAPDAAASLEGDVVAPPRADASAMAGALPESFPKEVPLPESASLVDFGADSVTLEVRAPLAEARAAYRKRLTAAGFAATGGDAWAKGARRIALAFAEEPGGTRITIEIR